MPATPVAETGDGERHASRPDLGGPPSVGVGVYIASDVRLYREGLAASLSRLNTLKVVGAGSLSVALRQVAEVSADVLLLDLAADRSLDLPREAQRIAPSLRVLAFAVAEVESNVLACAEAGICGYVPQDASAEDLAAAVALAMRGELSCSPRIAALLYKRVASFSSAWPPRSPETALTRREREIAGLVAEGLSNKEIARQLRLGNPTVKNHVHNILRKLDVRRRGQIGLPSVGARDLATSRSFPTTDGASPSSSGAA